MAPVAVTDSFPRDWLLAANVDGKALDKAMIKLEEEDVYKVGDLVELRAARDGGLEGLFSLLI